MSMFTTVPHPNLGCSTFMPACSEEVSLGVKSSGTLYDVAFGRGGAEVTVFLIPLTRLFAYWLGGGADSRPMNRVLSLMKVESTSSRKRLGSQFFRRPN